MNSVPSGSLTEDTEGTKKLTIKLILKILKAVIAIVCVLYAIGCTRVPTHLVILPLRVIDTVISQNFNGKIYTDKLSNYKIVDYEDNPQTLKLLEAFVKKPQIQKKGKYATYTMSFFEATDDTDTIMLKDHPSRFYNLENLLYEYTGFKGRFMGRIKYKNGERIEPKSKVTIKDIPLTPSPQ
ncbi:hypothetical protein HK413_07240 [Mucilaginibacter sp. S1162]|uniref:Lipoprotein n=1 Tax=Mucilaginibacter humi TaxID=2732510 RepID=A0ABX1W1E3_9SPHI|nr:hypothetical protein [Mucilaginibacter humi]NNU34003.1 hypothetical protein [Mucilaginibacter humi]